MSEQEEIEKVVKITKKGFDLQARLKGRGLRKATMTLFLEEELGVELGWAEDVRNGFGVVVGRDRQGVIGKLDELTTERSTLLAEHDRAVTDALEGVEPPKAPDTKKLDKEIAAEEKKRDELIEKLTETGLTVKLQAVPPVMEKDTRRRARQTLGIEQKGVPEEMEEDFNLSRVAHLITMVVQEVKDNQTGEVNEGLDYDDAISLMGLLSPGQFFRLDAKIGEVQYTDAISRQIEGQVDFS